MILDVNVTPQVRQVVEALSLGKRITEQQALVLYEQAPLALLGTLAVARKEQLTGREVYYNKNIHIEPTNICVFNCKFCSYRRTLADKDAWYYDLNQIEQIAAGYKGRDITEVHIVGGVHPSHTLSDYVKMVERVKAVLPHVVVKAYTAVELYYIIKQSGLSLKEGLQKLKDAGMLAMPGGGAEIFNEQIRAQICPDKPSSAQWLETHRAAHEIGISTNATILYGHIETPAHRIEHMACLRDLQDQTGGFDAFIPLKYRSANNSMSSVGEVSIVDDMRMLAISRLFLDNFKHIKAYWVMLGKASTELALSFGADDVDGTIDDTTKIYSMAGAADQKPKMSSQELEQMIRRVGYEPIERDTFYNKVDRQ